MAVITWSHPEGGSWHEATNWSENRVPANGDDVVIPALVGDQVVQFDTGTLDVASLTAGESIQVAGGSLTVGTIDQTDGQFRVAGGEIAASNFATGEMLVSGPLSTIAGLVVGEQASLTIAADAVATSKTANGLEIHGTMHVGLSATLTLDAGADGSSTRLLVSGTLVTNGATITSNLGSHSKATMEIAAGGRMQASNSSFAMTGLNLDSNVVFQNGDFANNVFETPVQLPARIVPLLADATGGTDNQSFRDIRILDEVFAGQLDLTAIGTASRANLRFVFPDGFTVANGGSLSIGENVQATVLSNNDLVVHGNLRFDPVSQFTLDATDGAATTRIVVDGTMTTDNAILFGDRGTSGLALIQILDGGTLDLMNSAFPGLTTELAPTSHVRFQANDGTGTSFFQGGLASTISQFESLTVSNASTAFVDASVQLGSNAVLEVGPSSVLAVAGTLVSSATDPQRMAIRGRLRFLGNGTVANPQQFEVASHDVGLTVDGFEQTNFAIGSIEVAANSVVRLVDQFTNGATSGAEAVYVDSLIVRGGATLDLNGLNVYTRALFIDATAEIVNGLIAGVLADGGAITPSYPTPGKIDVANEVDAWTFDAREGSVATVMVNPGSVVRPEAIPNILRQARIELVGPSGQVVTEATSPSSSAVALIDQFVLPEEGQYTVRVSAALPEGVGNYVITVLDETEDIRAPAIRVESSAADGMKYGDKVRFTTTVKPRAFTGPTVTGSVQWQINGIAVGAPVPLLNQTASLQIPLLAAGTHQVTARYISDHSDFDSSNSQPFTQVVNKASLTVRGNDLSKVAGASIPELTFEYSGFIGDETAAELTGAPQLSVSDNALNIAGEYPIVVEAGTLQAANYAFNFVDATMTVQADVPSDLSVQSGTNQSVKVQRKFAELLSVKLTDRFGNPIANQDIVFAAPSSGASATFAGGGISVNVATDSEGLATAPIITSNSVEGSYQIIASLGVIEGVFELENLAQGPALELTADVESISEIDGMVTFTLVRNTPLGQTLTVDISSNAASRLQLPASVSFAAEEETLQFTGNAIDNSDFDGDATATITAALTSFAASADVTIINDDPNPFPWHNLVDGLDVNDDTRVTSLDALVVLNFLNREGVGPLSSPRTGPFIDTNRDNVGSPIDALIIINFLNRQPGNGGEGEADSDAESSSIVRATDMALADFMQQEEKRRRDLRLS